MKQAWFSGYRASPLLSVVHVMSREGLSLLLDHLDENLGEIEISIQKAVLVSVRSFWGLGLKNHSRFLFTLRGHHTMFCSWLEVILLAKFFKTGLSCLYCILRRRFANFEGF